MKSLEGLKILITRDASQAGSFRDMLENEGASVICVPTIAIADPPDWTPFDEAAKSAARFDWIVFSSVNAVKQTYRRLQELTISTRSSDLPKIAVIGSQTAVVVESLGWEVTLLPDRYQSEELGDKLVSTGVEDKNIWIPRALAARNVLIDQLEKEGASVTMTPVYQNNIPLENKSQLEEALEKHKVDWITFTSSSTVVNFFKILDRDPKTLSLPKLASIGTITTKTLEKYALRPEFTAVPQNLEGLCQGLIDGQNQE